MTRTLKFVAHNSSVTASTPPETRIHVLQFTEEAPPSPTPTMYGTNTSITLPLTEAEYVASGYVLGDSYPFEFPGA